MTRTGTESSVGHAGHPRPARPGRVVLLTMLFWVCITGVASVRAQGPREGLDSFPKGTLEISSQDGPQQFHIWLADTTSRSEQGLMFVQSLAHDWGMLFPRNNPGPMAMWMKNTLIPLDMLFLDREGSIIYIRRSATPQSENIITVPAPVSTPVTAVLELAGGECDRRHINQGDRIKVMAAS